MRTAQKLKGIVQIKLNGKIVFNSKSTVSLEAAQSLAHKHMMDNYPEYCAEVRENKLGTIQTWDLYPDGLNSLVKG